ncbi:GfdT protein [Loktanella sp. IMCC34160]|uniref:FIST N-terminal domain-containing protein n=1 Tax=Loktanella sp. IMCC34160 TaxID=2510646 RepID=UPI00101C84D8|nr:FIST N-terminal domain-containing protein [Loktanella sp. IMCC34160]RYG90761.1 GfdT protein [Loktanella sp. IMCC34160]
MTSATDPQILRQAQVAAHDPDPVGALSQGLGNGPFALVALFVSPEADFHAVSRAAWDLWGGMDTTVIGCTTAGEIGAEGYAEGTILALGLPRAHFATLPVVIEDLSGIDPQDIVAGMIRRRARLTAEEPLWRHEFAFLMIDGLSVREDALVSALSGGLGPVPLFGGSAGDGDRFGETFVSINGAVLTNAAVLCLVRSDCPVKVFSLDHLRPTDTRMVVTRADPARRIVQEINAEPAAREYARLLGKDPEQLSAFTFAAHPVVVRFGGEHHVRSIQRVLENGDLVFYSAIDEGLVLTLAEPDDMPDHLSREMAALSKGGTRPEAIWACDCILRRIEAEQKQQGAALSAIMAQHRVVGFSTYGEQVGGMHVNQTMTGVAIYPPDGPEV